MAIAILVLAASGVAHAATPVTVYLDRDGASESAHDGVPAAEIPAFGGGDRTWNAVVTCVRKQYAPFAVEIVDEKPATGPYITAVIGGLASQLGLDDATTNGVAPYDGTVMRDAVVHVFSQVGTGERDVENLCAVTAHEVGHALGLDHEVYCGDVMSYYLDQCGARTFVDADAPCGEDAGRACGNGERTQSSYRLLAKNVGLREGDSAAQPRQPSAAEDPWRDIGDRDGDTRQPEQPSAYDDDARQPQQPPAYDDGDDAGAQPQRRHHRGHRGHRTRHGDDRWRS